ncbi:uncharacterized protein LOC121729134 [Aricia agestis]|uniref:uncharacterized protein LOC121729134 n=1 Tax=Aricia agestis TaxID=91739 RepID=UPI001C2046E1|nr:uncharacterized protein LOC121729134 [Aricia agestis]
MTSLRRTPPASSTGNMSHKNYDSDTLSERGGNDYVRQKRRRQSDEDIIMLSNKIDQYFSELKQQNAELRDSLQFMSDKYDTTLNMISKMEEKRLEDKKQIAKLEERLEFMIASIEIRNIPSSSKENKKKETKEDICELVQGFAKTLSVSLNESDIKDVYRVTTNKETIKPIIIELNRPRKPVYVSEVLTSRTQKIYHMARQFVKDYNYSYCWTSRGTIYIRKTEGEQAIRIESEEDLNKLKLKQ